MSSEGQIEHDIDDERVEQALNVIEARQCAWRLIPQRDFSFNEAANHFGASSSFHRTIRILETSSSDEEEVKTPRTNDVLIPAMSKTAFETPQPQQQSFEDPNLGSTPSSVGILGQSRTQDKEDTNMWHRYQYKN